MDISMNFFIQQQEALDYSMSLEPMRLHVNVDQEKTLKTYLLCWRIVTNKAHQRPIA
jgi:hypothetical protein